MGDASWWGTTAKSQDYYPQANLLRIGFVVLVVVVAVYVGADWATGRLLSCLHLGMGHGLDAGLRLA